jgi:hypothetical protein
MYLAVLAGAFAWWRTRELVGSADEITEEE